MLLPTRTGRHLHGRGQEHPFIWWTMNNSIMSPDPQSPAQFRLAELLVALSLVADLGMGHAPEEAVSACFMATKLARKMGLGEQETGDVYYTTLLRFAGCTSYAHEEAKFSAGQDVAMRAAGARRDFGRAADAAAFFLFDLARDAPLPRRAGAVLRAVAQGQQGTDEMFRSHCEVATMMARRMGLAPTVQQALQHAFERWDGKGSPRQLRRESVLLPARFAQVASKAFLFYRAGGLEAACAVVEQMAGGALDPEIVTAFLKHGPDILAELATLDACQAVVEIEPRPQQWISDGALDDVARAFADVADLKAPCLRGHSRAVAKLAAAAARQLAWAQTEVTTVYRAGLLHDIGRVGIANGIWEKPGTLTRSEWEQVRLHPYHTERILACAAPLAPLASVAGMHHERLDGSGYYRQASGAALPPAARLLAAADAYQAMTEVRPYRRAFSPEAAAGELLAGARNGQFDGAAVQAVLAAAGHVKSSKRRTWPAGLSDREVEVLVLITRGATNKQIAQELNISPKTAGHHVQHIYNKIDVSTRAGAAMFAMEQGLV
jgi:HD-GYP domain-containing protein (c-di-GMP phosphodiesterase class II)